MPEQKLTLSEVAKELDVPASTIIGMAKRGEVKQWKREDEPGQLYLLSQAHEAVDRDGPPVVRYKKAKVCWVWIDCLSEVLKRAISDWKHDGYCSPLQRPVVIVERNKPNREPGAALVIERKRFKGSVRVRDFISTDDLRRIKQARAGELVLPDLRLRLPELAAKFQLAGQTIITWANTHCGPLERPLRRWQAPDHAGHKLYWPADVEEALRDGTFEENGESLTDVLGQWKWLGTLPAALQRSIADWKKNGHCPPTKWGVQIVTRRDVEAMTDAPSAKLLIQRRWLRGTTKPRDFIRQQDLDEIARRKKPVQNSAADKKGGAKSLPEWMTRRQAKKLKFLPTFLRFYAANPPHPRGGNEVKRKPVPHPLLSNAAVKDSVPRLIGAEWRFYPKRGNGTWRLVYSGNDLRQLRKAIDGLTPPDKSVWASLAETYEYLPTEDRKSHAAKIRTQLVEWHLNGCTYLDGEKLQAIQAWTMVANGRGKRLAQNWYFSRSDLKLIHERKKKPIEQYVDSQGVIWYPGRVAERKAGVPWGKLYEWRTDDEGGTKDCEHLGRRIRSKKVKLYPFRSKHGGDTTVFHEADLLVIREAKNPTASPPITKALADTSSTLISTSPKRKNKRGRPSKLTPEELAELLRWAAAWDARNPVAQLKEHFCRDHRITLEYLQNALGQRRILRYRGKLHY
jgi:transposase